MINEKLQGMLDEINEASKEIPFGNSRFQNINFVLQGEITPARTYRHCLLRLNNRLNALKEAYYSLQLEDVDIEEMQEKLLKANKFKKRRLEIKIEQKQTNRIATQKMVDDCITEINDLYSAFQKLPKFTREEFEAEEREHFKLKLTRDVSLSAFGGAAGALQSLDNMGENTFAQNALNNPLFVAQEIEKARKLLKLEVKKDVDRIQ